MGNYIAPQYNSEAFTCPYCNVYTKHDWSSLFTSANSCIKGLQDIRLSTCYHCNKGLIWHNRRILFPPYGNAAMPHQDLPSNVKDDYMEAISIVSQSPRGAAALLRLAIQKLCKELGEGGKNINEDIASLVRKGLNPKIQQALDIVRVVGNEAVHPGELDLKDNAETVQKLFGLINLIVEEMITRPKAIDEMYNNLPETKLEAIAQRDSGS